MSSDVRVVHRDAHLLVLSKPPGIPTTTPHGGSCLAQEAARLDPTAPRLHASSRLDLPVSGLVTFARTREGNDALLTARRAGSYQRLYLGIAQSAPDHLGEWTEALSLDPGDPRRRVVSPRASARGHREAHTDSGIRATAFHGVLLELRPRTGRTHQLRVHAAHHGAPLLGDTRYGGITRVVTDEGRVVTARRVMLHCAALDLPDVASGGTLALRLAPPDDFASVWSKLGGGAAALVVPSDPLESG